MPKALYFIKVQQHIQATKDEKTREMEATNYRYIVDKMYVQTNRHGGSSLHLDGYRKNLQNLG